MKLVSIETQHEGKAGFTLIKLILADNKLGPLSKIKCIDDSVDESCGTRKFTMCTHLHHLRQDLLLQEMSRLQLYK